MKIKPDTLILNISLLLGLLYCRYISTVTNTSFSPVVADYLLICIVFHIGMLRFKQILNPITLLLPLCLAYLYYGFMISSRQEPLTFEAQACFYLFIVFYAMGTYFPFTITNHKEICLSKQKLRFVNLVFVAGLIVFLIECILNGGFPLLLTIIGGHYIYGEILFIPVLHYLVIIITIIPTVYYYFYRYNYVSKLYLYIVSIISIFVVLNALSRQLIIFCSLSYVICYIKLNKINSAKFILKMVSLAAIVFLLVGQVRLAGGKNKEVSSLEFLKAYSGVPISLDLSTFDVTFNLYTSLNFNTLNDMFNKTERLHYGMYVLKPLLKLGHFDDAFSFEYNPDLDGIIRLGTVIVDPYLDFGILGVIVFSFMYGSTLSGAFISYLKSDNLGHILIWSTLSYAMIMSVFANFFNVMTVWVCVLFALCFCFRFSWHCVNT